MKPELDAAGATDVRRAQYRIPSMKVMNESEVLVAFQMSATKIGAAGCWWNVCNSSGAEEDT